jgi:hypothetical protein
MAFVSSPWGVPATPPPTPPPTAPPSPTLGDQVLGGEEVSGWAAAVAPLIGLAISAAVAAVSGVAVALVAGWVVYFVVNTLVARWDAKVLARKGLKAPWSWAIVIMPVYLFKRQKLLLRHQLLTVVWVVTFILTVILQSSVLNGAASRNLTLDQGALQQQIVAKADETVAGGVTASCPSETLHQGETFQCVLTAIADGSTAIVNVTVQNNSGDLVWQVQQ